VFDLLRQELSIFAHAPKKRGLDLVHARQPKEKHASRCCHAALLHRRAALVEHRAIDPPEVVTVTCRPDDSCNI
jgi:hypothetical protein